MLLKLQDGGIKEIETDSNSYGGCETCDYGSSYINEITITMEKGTIRVETDKMYDHALSDGYMMQLILPNVDAIKGMTEQVFFEWLNDNLENECGESLKVCTYE